MNTVKNRSGAGSVDGLQGAGNVQQDACGRGWGRNLSNLLVQDGVQHNQMNRKQEW